MGYTFCVYETGVVHILDDGWALCGKIDEESCKKMGIWKITSTDAEGKRRLKKIKLLENLSKSEAIAVAHSLQVLSGINICGSCVASLYRNE